VYPIWAFNIQGKIGKNDEEKCRPRLAVTASTVKTLNKSLGLDVSQDGSFRIDGPRLYNLSIHNNYALHNVVIDIKGKGFRFYTFTFC
jgi:hypothetical protein